MKITNIDINRENWLLLLSDLCSFQGNMDKGVYQLERYCKCIDLDVKFILKTTIELLFDPQNNLMVTINCCLSTDCVSLRRSNYYWNDRESVVIYKNIKPEEDRTGAFYECIDEFIMKMNHFRICSICRLLYKDNRIDGSESTCVHCRYDALFHVKDTLCVICDEQINSQEQSFTLTCAHTYHSSCILLSFIKTAKRECPLCRETDSHQL